MTKCEIRIGIVGKIRAGDNAGHWLRIDDDAENTGGFLVHVSENHEFTRSGDDWVESQKDLAEYFTESQWEIDWQDFSDSGGGR